VRIEIPKTCGLKIADLAMKTGLDGQFRVLHALKDTRGVLSFFGDCGKGQLVAAKRYKKKKATKN